jgi:hypothetical protein
LDIATGYSSQLLISYCWLLIVGQVQLLASHFSYLLLAITSGLCSSTAIGDLVQLLLPNASGFSSATTISYSIQLRVLGPASGCSSTIAIDNLVRLPATPSGFSTTITISYNLWVEFRYYYWLLSLDNIIGYLVQLLFW